MAKLNENPIQAKDLQEYLDAEDNFAFELSIYRMCLDKDSNAEHAGTYQDPVSKIDRQFDIRMRVYRGDNILHLAIECKRLKPYFPLLVSRIPRGKFESYHESVVRGKSGYWNTRHRGHFYERGKFVGKSTNQIGRRPSDQLNNVTSPFIDGDTEVYGKWSQAIASSVGLVERVANFTELL